MTCELPLHLEGLSVPPPPNKEEDLLRFIGVSNLEIKLLLQKKKHTDIIYNYWQLSQYNKWVCTCYMTIF